jgi:DNA helicase-2/ATP-dependent DNA helicase PcrA
VGGQEFYERKEVKDVLAYLRVALWPNDEISLRRIVNYPARGIGPAALARATEGGRPLLQGLRDVAPELCGIIDRLRAGLTRGDAAGATRSLIEEIGLYEDLRDAAASAAAAERRIGNVRDLLGALEGRKDVRGYLHQLSLRANDDDAKDRGGEVVTLTTLHGAKGLEFPVVFVVGLEEELLPHARTLAPIATDIIGDAAAAADLDEERRLLYVGITRARERLYLTRARMRLRRGRAAPVTPSRFLQEIPGELVESEDRADDGAIAEACMAKLKALVAESH